MGGWSCEKNERHYDDVDDVAVELWARRLMTMDNEVI